MYILLYIYKWAYRCDVCLFVCLSDRVSVGMWRANGNPNSCTYLDEILHAYPHLFKEGSGSGLTPAPSPPGPGGTKFY